MPEINKAKSDDQINLHSNALPEGLRTSIPEPKTAQEIIDSRRKLDTYITKITVSESDTSQAIIGALNTLDRDYKCLCVVVEGGNYSAKPGEVTFLGIRMKHELSPIFRKAGIPSKTSHYLTEGATVGAQHLEKALEIIGKMNRDYVAACGGDIPPFSKYR